MVNFGNCMRGCVFELLGDAVTTPVILGRPEDVAILEARDDRQRAKLIAERLHARLVEQRVFADGDVIVADGVEGHLEIRLGAIALEVGQLAELLLADVGGLEQHDADGQRRGDHSENCR